MMVLIATLNKSRNTLKVLWTFSIYLESVAILPQLFLVSKTGEAESITSHYLFALGSYRALYILNWIYRYVTENSHYDLIAIVVSRENPENSGITNSRAGSKKTVLKGKKLQLPA
ncbi:hypothetical protein NQ317_008529 [Molorchus minor]|uniref:ER lumen protein-retaining receptor n=1 Tax=Molorchus minor TaxID=1323400 RepID=A0ABQ9IZW0_9CUCU|nr:hypothetical protein NQ317_008529 [Molorchus minor]